LAELYKVQHILVVIVTTLYFEGDYGDELRSSGFFKDRKHRRSQVVLGLLINAGGLFFVQWLSV
jgi:hypothetical protein